jgi:CBS domain-containing protein
MIKQALVKDHMTPNPITIHEDAALPDAHALMKEYGVRRLPVLDGHHKLVGILSQTDVREAQPSDATSLSIYELNYLLAKLQVKRIMSHPVITLHPDDSVGKAAEIMLDRKIGGIPVVNDHQQLVGIITESDIFRLVVQSYREEG